MVKLNKKKYNNNNELNKYIAEFIFKKLDLNYKWQCLPLQRSEMGPHESAAYAHCMLAPFCIAAVLTVLLSSKRQARQVCVRAI